MGTENKQFGIKVLRVIFGLWIVGLGTTCLLKSGLGSVPLSTMMEGMSHQFKISVGMSNILLNIVLIVPVLIWRRKDINLGTAITIFASGLLLDFWQIVLKSWVLPPSMPIQLVFSILGTVLVAFGLSYYIVAEIGLGPQEALTNQIVDAFHISYRIAKTVLDICLLVGGILLGGTFGLGTLISVTLSGVLMHYFIEKMKRGK